MTEEDAIPVRLRTPDIKLKSIMVSTRRLEEIKLKLEEAIDALPLPFVTKLRALYNQLEVEVYKITSSYQNEISDLEYDKDKLERQISTLEDQVDDLEGRIEKLVGVDTLNDQLKDEWWQEVSKKYTLDQLESVLGNKWNLKDI